jgi:hypothetical protein
MKKLMIGAAVAALTFGVSAKDLCSIDEEGDSCQAYNLKVTLKTLTPKTVHCKDSECKTGAGCISYYKNGKRTFKGIVWMCKSDCSFNDAKLILWRTDKGHQAVVGEPLTVVDTDSDGKVDSYTAWDFMGDNLAEAWRYEKKANKVSLTWEIPDDTQEQIWDKKNDAWTNEVEDNQGDSAELSKYGLKFAGLGSYDTKNGRVKNVSGNVAGWVTGDPTIETCDFHYAYVADPCDYFNKLCEDAVDGQGDEHLAAYGTWSLKYSKKVSGGTKSIAGYVPNYAL